MKNKRGRSKKREIEIKNKFLVSFFIVLLSLILIFSGCKKEGKKEVTGNGLEMSFFENAPPDNIVVNQQFNIQVKVKNNGEIDILPGKAKFYLIGIGENLKGYTNKVQNQNIIYGKKEGLPGEQTIIFATNAYSDLLIQNPFSLNLVVKSCYDYATIAQPTICVAKQTSEVCSIEGEKISENTNTVGPVQISSLKESVSGNKLNIEFTIENVGGGKVYMPETDCDKLILNDDVNEKIKEGYVKININDGGLGLRCRLLDNKLSTIESLSGYAQLGKVVCTKELANENSPAIIRITLDYKYVDSITKTLTINP